MQAQASEPRDGIVVAAGYGLKIFVERSHLVVHDGIGRDRRTQRFSRAKSGLSRVVVIGHAGFVTLEALRWIRDVGAAFVQIGRDGEVIAISSADRFHNTKLRRAQAALAAESDVGITISRSLIRAKLEQQLARATELRELWPRTQDPERGNVARIIRERLYALAGGDSISELRAIEAVAGRWYWEMLAGLPVTIHTSWRKRVPDHWHTAGPRTSALSGMKSSRKAATPAHALFNYAYAILETEATIVLQLYGLDPALGIMHTDKRYRGSLAADLMEAARPVADGIVLEILNDRELRRGDVYETREGVCRLGPPLVAELARRAPELRDPLSSHAHALANELLAAVGENARTPARRRHGSEVGKGSKRAVVPHQRRR